MSGTGHNGGPAFPSPLDMRRTGMSLLDWFAGQALITEARWALDNESGTIRDIAQRSYDLAEAMLAERDRRNQK